MFVVVSYDITDDKRRNKVADTLKNYGVRVQYSVFECLLDVEYFKKLIREISRLIDEEEDVVRIYRLCQGCVRRIKVCGKGGVTEDKKFYIV